MKQTLNAESLMQISLFEKVTKAKVKDCFEDTFKQLTFCVQEGQLFKAIGKNAITVKKIDGMFKKKVRVIEFNQDIEKFIANLCHPNKIIKVEFSEQKLWDETKRIAIVVPENIKSRGYLIGKGASNLRNMESIVKRYFKIDEIKIANIDEPKKEVKLNIPDEDLELLDLESE